MRGGLIEEIERGLGGPLFLGKIHWFEIVDSTNAQLKTLAESGAEEGTVLLAGEQTEGRGRGGRTWASPPGGNLFLSLLIRPRLPVGVLFSVNRCLSVAVCEAVEGILGAPLAVKWPNDLFCRGKKVGGILTECAAMGKETDYVIMGLGLNLCRHPTLDGSMGYLATDLVEESGARVDLGGLVGRVLGLFEGYYKALLMGAGKQVEEAWKKRCFLLGRRVRVLGVEGVEAGTVFDVAEDGALLVEDACGNTHRLLWGDVTIRPEGTGWGCA